MADRHLDDNGFVIPDPETSRQAIRDCSLCDDDGYTPAHRVCDHHDHRPAAKRGMQMIREAMGWEPK